MKINELVESCSPNDIDGALKRIDDAFHDRISNNQLPAKSYCHSYTGWHIPDFDNDHYVALVGSGNLVFHSLIVNKNKDPVKDIFIDNSKISSYNNVYDHSDNIYTYRVKGKDGHIREYKYKPIKYIGLERWLKNLKEKH